MTQDIMDEILKQAESGQEETAAEERETAAEPAADPMEQLSAERDELKDRLLRLAAETDNYKKRSEREKADFLKRANETILKDLLPVMANLGRVDMVVGACLGFDSQGRLLGDGRGLLDLFYAMLRHLGMKASSPLAIIAAGEQKMAALPRQNWDAAANLVITPGEVLQLEQKQPLPKLAALPRVLASLPVVRSVMVRRDQSAG